MSPRCDREEFINCTYFAFYRVWLDLYLIVDGINIRRLYHACTIVQRVFGSRMATVPSHLLSSNVLKWSVDDVSKWLGSLSLGKDYSAKLKGIYRSSSSPSV